MPRYQYQTNYNHQSRSAHRTKRLAAILVTMLLIAATVIAIDVLKQSRATPKTSSQEKSTVQAATISVFKTEYFQFQTNPSWSEISTNPQPGRYLYRSFRGPLVEQELIITVNKTEIPILSLTRTSRVLPVQIEPAGRLTAIGEVSDHCLKAVPKSGTRVPQVLIMAQVKFTCNPDSTEYNVVVGVVGGGTNLKMTRPDGTKAAYTITYRNLTATPSPRDMSSVIQTFETR